MLDQPLKCSIEDDELVIRIGLNTLKHAIQYHNYFYNDSKPFMQPYIDVADIIELTNDIKSEMMSEAEDGSSELTNFIDSMIVKAYENGSIGFNENWF